MTSKPASRTPLSQGTRVLIALGLALVGTFVFLLVTGEIGKSGGAGALLGLGSFVVAWLVILRIMAFASGWTYLAPRFPDSPMAPGAWMGSGRGRLGATQFQGSLHLAVGAEGIRFSSIFNLLSFGALPTFLVPWSEIENVTGEASLLGNNARVGIKGYDGTILLYRGLSQGVLDAWQKYRARPATGGAPPPG